jgi:hypothetical protein
MNGLRGGTVRTPATAGNGLEDGRVRWVMATRQGLLVVALVCFALAGVGLVALLAR